MSIDGLGIILLLVPLAGIASGDLPRACPPTDDLGTASHAP